MAHAHRIEDSEDESRIAGDGPIACFAWEVSSWCLTVGEAESAAAMCALLREMVVALAWGDERRPSELQGRDTRGESRSLMDCMTRP